MRELEEEAGESFGDLSSIWEVVVTEELCNAAVGTEVGSVEDGSIEEISRWEEMSNPEDEGDDANGRGGNWGGGVEGVVIVGELLDTGVVLAGISMPHVLFAKEGGSVKEGESATEGGNALDLATAGTKERGAWASEGGARGREEALSFWGAEALKLLTVLILYYIAVDAIHFVGNLSKTPYLIYSPRSRDDLSEQKCSSIENIWHLNNHMPIVLQIILIQSSTALYLCIL